MDIKQLQSLYNASGSNIKWAKHCLERMQERDISINDVESCLHTGEIIEDYPNDHPFPSYLIMGYRASNDIIHVVCAPNDIGTELWLITAYIPTQKKWMDDFKTRKVE